MDGTAAQDYYDSDIMMEPLHHPVDIPVVSAGADGGSECRWPDLCAAQGVTDAEREGSPQAPEPSIGRMNSKVPGSGWTRRYVRVESYIS